MPYEMVYILRWYSNMGRKKPPLVTGPEDNKKIETAIISPADLQKVISEKNNYVLIDVRDPSEYQEGNIPGAIIIL